MPQVETPYGTFVLLRRATWGFSVVRATRDCRCHYKPVKKGEYVIVEHRKRPYAPALVAIGWGEHVATYDLEGREVPLMGRSDE